MNREETRRRALVMLESLEEGAIVEGTDRFGPESWWVVPNPSWDWVSCNFRIKKTPKIVERWALSDEQGRHTTMLDLDSARTVADHWEMMGSTGICLTHLKGEEQPWQK